MTQIGIMIEGQDGLTWPRWQRLLQAAEDFGYQSVFRSDHFTNASGPDKDSLELWISLAYAASHSKTIEFGPLVAPITFRHPGHECALCGGCGRLERGTIGIRHGLRLERLRSIRSLAFPFTMFPRDSRCWRSRWN